MNRDDAKNILLLYRPGSAEADDPQMSDALALAKRDPELAGWLEAHCARQLLLRDKFRQMIAPAGLKEQIISEQAADDKIISVWHRQISLVHAVGVMAVVLLVGVAISFWLANHHEPADTLAVYQKQMVRDALSPYAMDLLTNDPAAMRAHLARSHAPADFTLPAPLQQAALAGCAVQDWQGRKVSMICFRTGKPLAPGAASDLWLFVVDRDSVKKIPAGAAPRFAKFNRLITATWAQGDKLYLLGTEGDEKTIRQYL